MQHDAVRLLGDRGEIGENSNRGNGGLGEKWGRIIRRAANQRAGNSARAKRITTFKAL